MILNLPQDRPVLVPPRCFFSLEKSSARHSLETPPPCHVRRTRRASEERGARHLLRRRTREVVPEQPGSAEQNINRLVRRAAKSSGCGRKQGGGAGRDAGGSRVENSLHRLRLLISEGISSKASFPFPPPIPRRPPLSPKDSPPNGRRPANLPAAVEICRC